jgi:hypothetical protein
MTERARLLALVTETEAEYRAKWTAINALNARLLYLREYARLVASERP